ncbi:glycogen debranching enzyme, partial [Streptomyces sp. SID8455]|nr:glycogen debranching enzyme [Streptomyces sp. SID8455]
VSYNDKRNDANGEGNRDGESHNRSWNCGAEGETDDPEVLELRGRQMRNFIATLMLSQGVPMLSHGDEFARTQKGNNNAYCQDNELAWIHWPDPEAPDDEFRRNLLEFTRSMVWLRRDHP